MRCEIKNTFRYAKVFFVYQHVMKSYVEKIHMNFYGFLFWIFNRKENSYQITAAREVLLLLAYMATSGGHFSRPWGMGSFWS